MADAPSPDPVARARALGPLVAEAADEAERERRLPERVAVAMAEAGLYRVALPEVYGGLECDPRTQIETIEAVSEADGAAGWNLMIGIENMGFLGPALAPATAEKVFADPLLIVSGALNPLGRATPVEGGLRVDGRWPFASGCHNAHYFWGQCVVYDGDAPAAGPHGGPMLREVLLPRSEFEIADTWHVAGLRGSGSHDVVARDLFVPDERVTCAMQAPLVLDHPIYKLPPMNRLAYNKVGVATGIARAAFAAFTELASETKRRGSSAPLREKPAVQRAVADAAIALGSARAFVFETVEEIWQTVLAGDATRPAQRARVHLACSTAGRAAGDAVALLHEAAGSGVNFDGHPLERRLRDVRVVPQHLMVSPQWLECSGGVLLGLSKELPFG
ncbi:MAG: acyl-CoA dehydrogenase family protein [Myxococcota bacterium]